MSNKKKKERVFESVEQEILFLRRQNASLRGLNTTLRREAERYKNLDLEGDQLYEARIEKDEKAFKEQFGDLKVEIEEKSRAISKLNSEIISLRETISEKNDLIVTLKSDVKVADANLEYYKSLPWYKKIFAQ